MTPTVLPWLEAPLRQAQAAARGHAVLLHGPPGVGRFELALALAAAWLCEGVGVHARPCGRCGACRLVQARSHPDLLVVVPAALRESLGWATDAEDDGAGGKAKPSKDILVADVRALIAFSQTTASRGGVKVAVLHPAERMNAVAANTLLKTLEEPPGAQRFVLTAEAVDRLLPTVRSRCQPIALAAPPPDLAVRWLAEQALGEPELLLTASGGLPLEALAAAADGVDAALLRQLPQLVRAGDPAPLAKLPVPRLVDLLQRLCHDLQRRAAGAEPRYFPLPTLGAGDLDPDALAGWSRELAVAARQAEHPWNASLAAEALIFRGRRAVAAERGTVQGGGSLNSGA